MKEKEERNSFLGPDDVKWVTSTVRVLPKEYAVERGRRSVQEEGCRKRIFHWLPVKGHKLGQRGKIARTNKLGEGNR